MLFWRVYYRYITRVQDMWFSSTVEACKVGWQESLDAFKPSQSKVLILVSLRAVKNLYKALLYAFFLPTTLLAGLVLGQKGLIGSFYITLIARAARPSIDLKKRHYWAEFNFVDWVVYIGLLLNDLIYHIFLSRADKSFLFYLLNKLHELLSRGLLISTMKWLPGTDALGALLPFMSPFVIIWVFFMLDSKKSVWEYIKALGRALLMMFYNYPFFLFTYLVLRIGCSLVCLASRPFTATYTYLPIIGWVVLIAVVIPFYVCFIMNFYVKKVHEQFGLYY